MKRRFLRFLKGLGVVVLVLAVMHGIATLVLGRRFAAELAKIRASGAYISVSELGGPPVADADNAAVVYKRVFERLDGQEASKQLAVLNQVLVKEQALSASSGNAVIADLDNSNLWSQATKSSAYFDDIVPIAREAVAKPSCKFPVNWEAGAAASFMHLGLLRNLSRVLAAQAIVLAHDGKMDAAVDRLRLGFTVGQNTCNEPTLIAFLVKRAMLGTMTEALKAVLSYGNVSARQAAALNSDISHVDVSSDLGRAMRGERTFGLWAYDLARRDGMRQLFQLAGERNLSAIDNSLSSGLTFLWRPVLYADATVYLKHMAKQVSASSLPYRLSSRNTLDVDTNLLPRYAIVARIVLPIFTRTRATADDLRAQTALAQTLIAAQQYKKQTGAYPASLKELGARTPEDPFSGNDLIYKRVGNGFQVYSIGANLRDDGGVAPKADSDLQNGDRVLNWPR